MQQNLELLTKLPFFAAFPNKALKLLAFLAERVHLAPGDTLFEEGDDQGKAYLVFRGELQLIRRVKTEDVVIRRFVEGDFFGSFSLLGPLPALFTLQAAEAAGVLTINRAQFSKILEQFPETHNLAIKAILTELHQWERRNIHHAAPCCLSRVGATAI